MVGSDRDSQEISVTIITLTYRDFSGLEETIKSVFEQDFSTIKSVEYIIADDGSHNYSSEFFASLISKCEGCNDKLLSVTVYSNSENVGTVRSFNKAISLSSGDIIIPLSAGDAFYDNKVVSLIVEAFSNHKAPILTAYRELSNNGKALAIRPSRSQANILKSGDSDRLLNLLAVRGNFISGACTYYRREFLERVGGFDETYTLLEDYPFYVQSLNAGYSIGFIDAITMRHQVGGVSNSRHRQIHPSLERDFKKSQKWIQDNVLLSSRDKRMFEFFQVKSRKQKLSPKAILMNVDCFLIWFGSAVYDKFLEIVARK